MTVSTEGDAGDSVYVLSLLHDLGGQHTLLFQESSVTKARGEEGITKLVSLVAPLAQAQSYITEARRIRPDDKVDWQSAKFRQQGHYHIGESLLGAHRRNLEATLGLGHGLNGQNKWLTAIPDKRAAGRIIINRTGRYRNPHFPWAEIVKHYSYRLLFVGVQHEWKEFIAHHGYVDFQPTGNLLEVAQLIAGSELFIGNQSCAFAVAEGLKHPRILEASLEFPDTVFGGGNVTYVAEGSLILPDIDGSGTLDIRSKAFQLGEIPSFVVPPGGWQYYSERTGQIMTSHVDTCARQVRKKLKNEISIEEAKTLVMKANVLRVPRFFSKNIPIHGYGRVHAALKAAGVTQHPVIDLMQGNFQFTTNL